MMGQPSIEFPLANTSSTLPCFLVKEFISREECQMFIKKADSIGFENATENYPPSYRNNERIILDSDELSEVMTSRLIPLLKGMNFYEFDKDGHQHCKLLSTNNRFRLCRYQPGQEFKIHQDGV